MIPTLPDLVATAAASVLAYLETITASPQQIVAHVAAAIGVAFVSVAALVRTMIPLRWLAVGSWAMPNPAQLLVSRVSGTASSTTSKELSV